MNSKLFNTLRFATEVGLPALATLLTAIGVIWTLEVMVPIVATVVAVNTFIGAVVGVSRIQHQASQAV